MNNWLKIAVTVIVILCISMFLLFSLNTEFTTGVPLPQCVTLNKFSCENLIFHNATANLTLTIEQNSSDWSDWALAFAQPGSVMINNKPNVFFILEKGGFVKGETKQISLNSSMTAPVRIGTAITGNLWVCYVLNGTITSAGKGYCQANSAVHYVQIATLTAKAT